MSETGRGVWVEHHRTTMRLFGLIPIWTQTEESRPLSVHPLSSLDMTPEELTQMPVGKRDVPEQEPLPKDGESCSVDDVPVTSTPLERLQNPSKDGTADGIKQRRPFTAEDYRDAHALKQQGLSCEQIAQALKRSESTIRRWLDREHGPAEASTAAPRAKSGSKVSPEEQVQIVALLKKGRSANAIHKRTGRSVSAITRIARAHGIAMRPSFKILAEQQS